VKNAFNNRRFCVKEFTSQAKTSGITTPFQTIKMSMSMMFKVYNFKAECFYWLDGDCKYQNGRITTKGNVLKDYLRFLTPLIFSPYENAGGVHGFKINDGVQWQRRK
jgi:hypothetical protein